MTTATTKAIAADIARELRANPKAWTQGTFGRDANGIECHIMEACSWCLIGHIDKRVRVLDEQGEPVWEIEEVAEKAFRAAAGIASISHFNDAPERSVSDIIAMCEKVAGIGDVPGFSCGPG